MKRILLILLFITGIHSAHAQTDQSHFVYFTGELGYGNYIGVDFNINYLYLEKYSMKLGYSGHVRKAKSLPYDYSSGFFNAMLLGLAGPADQLGNFQVGAGRILRLNKKGTMRVNFSLGLGYTTIREPENWQDTGNSLLEENYTWDYGKHRTMSLIINPKIEFPLTRFYGLSLSPMLQLNKDRIYFGIGLGQMIGPLRNQIKPVMNEI